MNTQSPLIPQGSLPEQKNLGRARVKIAVFFVLAIHCVGLLALLMQGCQKDKDPAKSGTDQTNNPAPAFDSTALPAADASGTGTTATPVPPPGAESISGAGTEYTIAKGDTFDSLATRFHVKRKAIADANPTVEPTKLQIGQKIHIPPPTAPGTGAGTGTTPTITASGEEIYAVKSGDTLTGIAATHHTTVKALRAANDLKTDNIKVGQKLKIPAKGSSTESAPPSPAPGPTPR